MEDEIDDAIAIATAYREASESDSLDVLNAQSRCSGEGTLVLGTRVDSGTIDHVKYYLVASEWMKRAWRSVLKPPSKIPSKWQELVGPVDNSVLTEALTGEATQDNMGVDNQSAGMPTGTSTEGEKLRSDLQHERDFYLVGSNAWLLLYHKFGATHTFAALVRVHKTQDSNLAVDLQTVNQTNGAVAVSSNKGSFVPIPASGRFPYETTLYNIENENWAMFKEEADGCRNLQPAGQGHILGHTIDSRQPVSDDDDDLNSNAAMKDASSDGCIHDEDDISNADGSPSGQVLLLPPSNSGSGDVLFSPLKAGATTNGSNDFGFVCDEANNADSYWTMESDPVPIQKTKTITTLKRFRYGSGLGNLGNTCFMNSTLQCLGHTHELQSYFLSGEFRHELNRDNPLGTGGELATAFAKLLTEMWSEETMTTVSVENHSGSGVTFSNKTNHTIYPRDFKYTVGKHAEQFMGYDQHDSQEFATYLLDALHEDTNRVTKKPYIEKPEQEDGESDEAAAEKAWELHLQRENSKVLENFMGQVKSRVQCCEPGCARVSTTFDPFMYLSVPLPGSSERTLSVVFVPLDPYKRAQRMSVIIAKSATIQELLKKTRDVVLKIGVIESADELALEDMVAADVWQKDIHRWYGPKEDADMINDNDETYIYQVRSAAELRAQAKKKVAEGGDEDMEMYNLTSHEKHYTLDIASLTRLNAGDAWTNEMGRYLQNHLGFLNAFNPTKGSNDDRIKHYQRTQSFLDLCFKAVKDMDFTNSPQPNLETLKELVARCDASPVFENVKSMHDLAILEFCAGKMRAEILRMIKAKKNESPGGVKIQVSMKTSDSSLGSRNSPVCVPVILRVPTSMTVHNFRQELATKFSRSLLGPGDNRVGSTTKVPASGQATSEYVTAETEAENLSENAHTADTTFGTPGMVLMRQLPMTFDRKGPSYTHKHYDNSHQLGSLESGRSRRLTDNSRPAQMASPQDHEELQHVAQLVGDQGVVYIHWPLELLNSFFSAGECDAIEEPKIDEESNEGSGARATANKTTTILDCIDKYCQMEQLEETEMWYCNRCKKHVRAWKQFHLYRTPPILIVHLKRFQYSATTHRRDKISLFIDFPLKGLDLSDHVMHWDGDGKPIYDCYAVSNHYGGLGGGHYTAHALNDDGVWCYYDDSRITVDVDPKQAVTDAAYVLYYRRRDLDVNEDFLLTIPTPDPEGITPSAPAIIGGLQNQKGLPSENAAIVDDDNMDLEEASHTTEVMEDGDYIVANDARQHSDEVVSLPRQ